MKHLYSIGEVSDIMGISVQTLRYYSTIGLISPTHINPSSGYRYYSADQFHFIDRIKYLQKIGFSLSEIQSILVENNIDLLIQMLDDKKTRLKEERNRLEDSMDSIEWYRNYFAFGELPHPQHGSTIHLKTRYLVATKVMADEPKEDFHIRLNKIKNSAPLKHLNYMRQFSYVLDYEAFLQNRLQPLYLGMFIKDHPKFQSELILEVPEGDYFCMTARILSNGWNPYEARVFFDKLPVKPTLVLANEYEDNLHEYYRCIYEVQILIPNQ